MRDTHALIDNPRNPNRHGEEQIRLLVKVIGTTGWRAPIVVSARSGFVVKGHGRLSAARLAGWEQVPVDVREYADEATEWADMIADNRLAELADMDAAALKDLLGALDTGAVDMELAGFTEMETERVMSQFLIKGDNDMEENMAGTPEYNNEGIMENSLSCIVRFKTEEDRAEFERFIGWKLSHKGSTFSTWFPKPNFDQLGNGLTYRTE